MTYTYFTEFYKKICEILSVNTGMPSQASSLVSNCDSDIVRIKEYLNEIISSNWKESGAVIIRNNIVNQISKNVGEVNKFIKNNLEASATISINKLLPELKDMKAKDELLYKNKTRLESMKSSLTILQNNMPSKYETDANGIKHINSDYTAAVNQVNRLIQEINELGKTIRDQIQALNTLKGVVDGYIMEISTLGNENIVIPSLTLPSENDFNELPLLQAFSGGTVDVIDINGVKANLFIPSNFLATPDTKLTIYMAGSGDKGCYFSNINDPSYGARTYPKGPVLIMISDNFYDKKFYTGADFVEKYVQAAREKLNIINENVSIVSFSRGTNVFRDFISKYGSQVDKAVLISPAGPPLNDLTTKAQYKVQYQSIGSVQIIQADNEKYEAAREAAPKIAELPNTKLSYFSGKHEDYERILAGMYTEPTSGTTEAPHFTGAVEDYIDPNFDLWEFIDSKS